MQNNKISLRPIQFENNEIRITDFYIIAAIYSAGETPKKILKHDNKVIFIFNNSGAALAISAAYIANGTYEINLRDFVNSAANVRNIIFNKMRSEYINENYTNK